MVLLTMVCLLGQDELYTSKLYLTDMKTVKLATQTATVWSVGGQREVAADVKMLCSVSPS